jgi:hypothetical protein
MKRSSFIVLLVAAVTILASVAALSVRGKSKNQRRTFETPQAGTTPFAPSSSKVVDACPAPGTELTYEVQYRSEGFAQLGTAIGGQASNKESSKHSLLGTLVGTEILTVLGRGEGGGCFAAIRYHRPAIGIGVDSQPQPAKEKQIALSLSKLVSLRFGSNGKLERVSYPPDYGSMGANYVRAIVGARQFVTKPDHRLTSSWTTEEVGAAGPYSARYEIVNDSGTTIRVAKTISSSPESQGTRTDAKAGIKIMPTGKIVIELSQTDGVTLLTAVYGERALMGGQVLSEQSTSLKCRLLSRRQLSQDKLAALAKSLSEQPRATLTPEEEEAQKLERSTQEQILGHETVQSILKELSDVDIRTPPRDEQVKLYLRTKALLYVRPKDASILGRGLSTRDFTKPSSEIVVTALSAVGSADAQDVLCAATRSRASDGKGLSILLPSIGSLTEPTACVVALVQELSTSASREIRSLALLALGSIARNLETLSKQRSNVIVRDLATRLSSPVVADDKTTVLLALGNTNSELARTVVIAERLNPSPTYRRAVASSLAGFSSAPSDTALCEMLRKDVDAQVRSAAAQALGARNRIESVKHALLDAALQDQVDGVRIASLFALTPLIAEDVSVQRVVQRIADRDASEVVRRQASSLLPGGGSQK